jgi:N-acetylglutamate synthase-like GNAT family acetyltransferase
MKEIKVREIKLSDTNWIKEIFIQYWAGDFLVTRGKIHRIMELSGYIAELSSKKVGLITHMVTNKELEITGLVSNDEKKGIGTALINSIINLARQEGIKRIYLVTTNDNLNALGFWQKRGFKLVRVYPNAMEVTRRLKPSLPLIGEDNIPLRDELELEMIL